MPFRAASEMRAGLKSKERLQKGAKREEVHTVVRLLRFFAAIPSPGASAGKIGCCVWARFCLSARHYDRSEVR